MTICVFRLESFRFFHIEPLSGKISEYAHFQLLHPDNKPLIKIDSLSVDIPPVSDSYDANNELLVLNLVNDPIPAAAKPVLFLA